VEPAYICLTVSQARSHELNSAETSQEVSNAFKPVLTQTIMI
jgi:hypothetical protein